MKNARKAFRNVFGVLRILLQKPRQKAAVLSENFDRPDIFVRAVTAHIKIRLGIHGGLCPRPARCIRRFTLREFSGRLSLFRRNRAGIRQREMCGPGMRPEKEIFCRKRGEAHLPCFSKSRTEGIRQREAAMAISRTPDAMITAAEPRPTPI